MKMVKSLILGSAAALVAMSGAQAADLPVKAKAVEYVKVCSLYGAGFYYIPGTDTCIKLGGYLRVEVTAGSNSVYGPNYGGVAGARNRMANDYTWRSRQDLTIDTRTATEYGVVRTFFDATFTWTSGGYTGAGTGLVGGGASSYDGNNPAGSGSGQVAGGNLGVYYAFIQFAGFTIGKAISQFSAPWTNYPGNNFDGLVGGGGTVTGVNQFNYTAQFGNGVSANIGVQDPTAYYQAGINNVGLPLGLGGYGANNYGGSTFPDIVGQLRVDQAWGLFQVSAAGHHNNPGYYGTFENSGGPEGKWGYAVAAALSIKNIPTGPGDTINVQGVYTHGATRYNIQDLAGGAGAVAIYGNTGLPGAYGSIGIGNAPDAVFGTGGSLELISTWGFRGAYTHNWSPEWNTAVYGAYAQVDYNGAATALVCGGVGAARFSAGLITCNPDYNIAQVGMVTRWTPVRNLTFSGDVVYTMLDQKHTGVVTAGSVATAKPAAVYEVRDQNTWIFSLRAQRNF
jgi:hypothetical protein